MHTALRAGHVRPAAVSVPEYGYRPAMIDMVDIIEWFRAHDSLMYWSALGSATTFVGSLIIVPILVIRIPDDYFLARRRRVSHWRRLHPVPGIALLVLKNVCGIVFIVPGIAIPVLPGQGILAIPSRLLPVKFPRTDPRDRPLRRRERAPRTLARYPRQPRLRALAPEDLDAARVEFLTRETISRAGRGELIHPAMVEARNALLAATPETAEPG